MPAKTEKPNYHWIPRRGGPEKACEECGVTFKAWCAARLERARFCSRACHGRFHGRLRKGRVGASVSEARKIAMSRMFARDGNPNWRGGVRRRADGYIQVHVGTVGGRPIYELEHRLIAARALGRPLKRHESVHHVNMNTSDNRRQNLVVCPTGYNTWLVKHYAALYARLKFGGPYAFNQP